MQVQPYSIYIDKRPLRIVFLVNPNKFNFQQFDAVLKYNMGKWGGRFNPIIFTDGKSIEEKWWKFLRDVDADVIKSLVPLQNELLEKIENFLSPYSVEVPQGIDDNGTHHSIHIYGEGLPILPTPDNVAKVSRFFMSPLKLVLFELSQMEDEIVKQFICRNFGIYTHNFHVDSTLGKNEKKIFPITNRLGLSSAFMELSTFERFIYPIQLCSLPNSFQDVEHDRMGGIFTVVVGDSPEDIIYSWNRTLLIPSVIRTGLHQVWLPTELANDAGIENALKSWLNRAADPSGTTNEEIQFVSFSLRKAELEKIAERFTKNTGLRRAVTVFNEPQIPNFQPRDFYLRLKENMDLYRATGSEEEIVLNEPNVLKWGMSGEHWMADVYIQFKPERYTNFIGNDLWWQLPQRNHLARRMFQKPSRIGLDGFPSVLMTRGGSTLSIKLPDEESVFRTLIVGENTPPDSADPRNKFVYRPFDDIEWSDKGHYLSGFLGIFSGLSFAHQIIKERYWRRMFDILSLRDPTKYAKRQETILNDIRKKIKKHGLNERNLDWWTNKIFNFSKQLATSDTELPFLAFVNEAKRELEEFNKSRQENQKLDFNEEEVKDIVSNLAELDILLIGIRSRCPQCGYAHWYHIDEVRQSLQCRGCGYKYPMRPQEEWYYKLNALVQAGCTQHGLVPVVLVLGQLLKECRSSFIFTTSLDLFKKIGDDAFGDLDIVCIQDGKFIVGEIKQSIGLFTKENFEKMADIAERLKPDILIFSSLDSKPNALVNDSLAALRKRLAPLGVDVNWYKLHPYIFEPSPV